MFKVTPAGVETVIHAFGAAGDGYSPVGRLIVGSDGNFYGTTTSGGALGGGTLFKITPAGVETIIYSFGKAPDATQPESGVIIGSDGNFYGTGAFGGAHNDGAVFKVTPAGVETVLYSFGGSSTDGVAIVGGLVQGADGNLYGVAEQGGTMGDGIIFMVNPTTGAETILHNFGTSATDGIGPQAAMTLASDGNFYGTTSDSASVFKLTSSGVFSTIYNFANLNSGDPEDGPLVQDSAGNLYGATQGAIYKITTAGVETTLYTFGTSSSTDGSSAFGVIIGSDGHLYGTTNLGGTNNDGTVFRF